MKADILIVGAGIIGLSTAYQLSEINPSKKIVVLDKEARAAEHQTGHNSGVIHSGIYYRPGSYKAEFAKNGSASMIEFCKKHNIEYNQCRKVIVATEEEELERMRNLYERGLMNKLDVTLLDGEAVRKIEPYVNTVGGIHVKNTGIVNFREVTEKFGELFINNGGEIHYNNKVEAAKNNADTIAVTTNKTVYEAEYLVNCAGLYSDKLAKWHGLDTDDNRSPLRREHLKVNVDANKYDQTSIYPGRRPEVPYLGVHHTDMVGWGVDLSPNAVLGFKKESDKQIGFDKSQ